MLCCLRVLRLVAARCGVCAAAAGDCIRVSKRAREQYCPWWPSTLYQPPLHCTTSDTVDTAINSWTAHLLAVVLACKQHSSERAPQGGMLFWGLPALCEPNGPNTSAKHVYMRCRHRAHTDTASLHYTRVDDQHSSATHISSAYRTRCPVRPPLCLCQSVSSLCPALLSLVVLPSLPVTLPFRVRAVPPAASSPHSLSWHPTPCQRESGRAV